jgi:hypothetical protein
MTKVHCIKEKKENENKIVFNNGSRICVKPLH